MQQVRAQKKDKNFLFNKLVLKTPPTTYPPRTLTPQLLAATPPPFNALLHVFYQTIPTSPVRMRKPKRGIGRKCGSTEAGAALVAHLFKSQQQMPVLDRASWSAC